VQGKAPPSFELMGGEFGKSSSKSSNSFSSSVVLGDGDLLIDLRRLGFLERVAGKARDTLVGIEVSGSSITARIFILSPEMRSTRNQVQGYTGIDNTVTTSPCAFLMYSCFAVKPLGFAAIPEELMRTCKTTDTIKDTEQVLSRMGHCNNWRYEDCSGGVRLPACRCAWS
jgi:hypothetical protein